MSSSHKLKTNKYKNEDMYIRTTISSSHSITTPDAQGDPKLQDEDRTKAR